MKKFITVMGIVSLVTFALFSCGGNEKTETIEEEKTEIVKDSATCDHTKCVKDSTGKCDPSKCDTANCKKSCCKHGDEGEHKCEAGKCGGEDHKCGH